MSDSTAINPAATAELDREWVKSAAASLRHPLTRALLVLTLTTGLVDAVSYLGLGRVFTANITNTGLGLILVGANAKVLMQGAANFPTNNGIISLTGGTFELIEGPRLSISSIRARYFVVMDRALYLPLLIPACRAAIVTSSRSKVVPAPSRSPISSRKRA